MRRNKNGWKTCFGSDFDNCSPNSHRRQISNLSKRGNWNLPLSNIDVCVCVLFMLLTISHSAHWANKLCLATMCLPALEVRGAACLNRPCAPTPMSLFPRLSKLPLTHSQTAIILFRNAASAHLPQYQLWERSIKRKGRGKNFEFVPVAWGVWHL